MKPLYFVNQIFDFTYTFPFAYLLRCRTLHLKWMKLILDLPLTRVYLLCEFHWDWTKHSGSYHWGVCPGPCMMDSITLFIIPRACIHLQSLQHTAPHPGAGPLWVSSRSAPDSVFRGVWPRGTWAGPIENGTSSLDRSSGMWFGTFFWPVTAL